MTLFDTGLDQGSIGGLQGDEYQLSYVGDDQRTFLATFRIEYVMR
jgi:hypothetical protein